MPFPPRFLDELRARVSLAQVAGRRVKLVKRGREYVGLCPFHNEKTPSFSVVEEKGFFHCFGCGAHGDAIGFVMQTEGLGFLDAVESLAREAGLQVPKPTREEHERAQRQIDLQGAMEAACVFFEQALAAPEGRAAKEYLLRRGLDAATIGRFRLGFSPERRDALKGALVARCGEALLMEAGLLRKPEDGGASYDQFRGRVMFPIGDRTGRIIAFGARALGDAQPKYLNSPETPLFVKGRVLYGWAQARAAAAREPQAIVVEGYMDVIALQRAGFGGAVAPLGTALTEAQLEELWRLAPEPILCFDGDAAGQRAAGRALERALPLLKPGQSLRFAILPEGEDPDTLVLRHGAAAMRELLDRARPLAETIWTIETAKPLDTPERQAALESRLEARVRQIAERSVQERYRDFFRERVFAQFRRVPASRRPKGSRGMTPGRGRPPLAIGVAPASDPGLLRRRQQEVLLAVLLNHPFIIAEAQEDLSRIELTAGDLDRLYREILKAPALLPELDAAGLKLHLRRIGFTGTVEGVLSPQVLTHASFARADAGAEAVRAGWAELRTQFQHRTLSQQISEAERDLAVNTNEETWSPMQALITNKNDEDGTAEEGIR